MSCAWQKWVESVDAIHKGKGRKGWSDVSNGCCTTQFSLMQWEFLSLSSLIRLHSQICSKGSPNPLKQMLRIHNGRVTGIRRRKGSSVAHLEVCWANMCSSCCDPKCLKPSKKLRWFHETEAPKEKGKCLKWAKQKEEQASVLTNAKLYWRSTHFGVKQKPSCSRPWKTWKFLSSKAPYLKADQLKNQFEKAKHPSVLNLCICIK